MSTLSNDRRRRSQHYVTKGGGGVGEEGEEEEVKKKEENNRMIFPIMELGLSTCLRFFLAKNQASTSCLSSPTAGSLLFPSLKVAYSFVPHQHCSLLGPQVTEAPIALKIIYIMIET